VQLRDSRVQTSIRFTGIHPFDETIWKKESWHKGFSIRTQARVRAGAASSTAATATRKSTRGIVKERGEQARATLSDTTKSWEQRAKEAYDILTEKKLKETLFPEDPGTYKRNKKMWLKRNVKQRVQENRALLRTPAEWRKEYQTAEAEVEQSRKRKKTGAPSRQAAAGKENTAPGTPVTAVKPPAKKKKSSGGKPAKALTMQKTVQQVSPSSSNSDCQPSHNAASEQAMAPDLCTQPDPDGRQASSTLQDTERHVIRFTLPAEVRAALNLRSASERSGGVGTLAALR